jgi:hypothetical protein
VRALATTPTPARWFEAWNEPEVPTFWAGLPAEWLDLAAASARAVHQVATETGLDLTFGGPASVVPDPVLLTALQARLAAQGTPMAFASWHYYGNLPCLGPDGPEPGLPGGQVQAVLGCHNPFAALRAFGPQVDLQRGASRLASPGAPRPALALDEWNLSSGGLDRRHDTLAGAAFDAATLVQLQDHGLDWATFFKATDNSAGAGDLGVVHLDGRRKPAWWSFSLWQQLAPEQVAVRTSGTAPVPAVMASRSADGRQVTVLLASFTSSCHGPTSISLRLIGLPGPVSAMVRFVDSEGAAPTPRALAVRHRRVRLGLPACSVALVEVHAN